MHHILSHISSVNASFFSDSLAFIEQVQLIDEMRGGRGGMTCNKSPLSGSNMGLSDYMVSDLKGTTTPFLCKLLICK